MGQINDRLRSVEGRRFRFFCPGCKDTHDVGLQWGFNGNFEAPTISPSLLVTCGHYVERHKQGDSCWCTYNAEHADRPSPFKCYRCHSFIENGQIRFLGDCTHELANQTVPIPPLPAEHRDPT